MRCRRGVILADVVLGLVIVAATGALLSTTIARHHKAGERLAGSRAAVRAAERVLTDLQLEQPPPANDDGSRWEIQRLEAPAPPGQSWVEVRAFSQERSASLTGLVPAGSVNGGAP